MRDVIADAVATEDRAAEPSGRIIKDRYAVRALVPSTLCELVDLVAGLFTKERSEVAVLLVENVHGQATGVLRDPVRVVLLGKSHQKPRWVDARLSGESDETSRGRVLRPRRDHEHRVVEQVDDSAPLVRHR